MSDPFKKLGDDDLLGSPLPKQIPEAKTQFDPESGREVEVIRKTPTSILSRRLDELQVKPDPPVIPKDAAADRAKRQKLDDSLVARIKFHRRRGRRYYNITVGLNVALQLAAAVGAIGTAGEWLPAFWLTIIVASGGFAGSMLTTMKPEAKSRWYYDFYHGLSKVRNLLVYKDLPSPHAVDLLDTLAEEMTKTFPSFGNK